MGLILDSWLLEIGILLGSLLAYAIYKIHRKQQYFQERGFPYVEPTFLLGNNIKGLLFMEPVGDPYERFYKKHSGNKVLGLYQGWTPQLMIIDPDLVYKVMVKDFSYFHDRGIRVDEETNPLEGHLFGLGGDRWRFMRNKLAPTFTSGKLKGMYPIMTNCGDLLMKSLEERSSKGDIEMLDCLACFTTDVIASCVFGYEPQAITDPNSQFRKMGRQAFLPTSYEIMLNVMRFAIPEIFFKLKLKTIRPEMDKFFTGIVKEAFEYRTRTGTKRNDFMQLLLQLKEKGEVEVDPRDIEEDEGEQLQPAGPSTIKITDGLLAAQAFVFLLAGFETSATTMTFTLYNLAKHPEIQEKVRKEVRAMREKHGDITYAAVKEMTLLDACVSETLRLFPPLRILFRECTKNYTLSDLGLTIEKGTNIVLPVHALHTDPRYFPDPLEFKPERFLNESSIIPGTYIPFGDGPRICIGRRFALVEAQMGLARIIESYELSVSSKQVEPIPINPKSFLAQPLNGLWLKLTKAV